MRLPVLLNISDLYLFFSFESKVELFFLKNDSEPCSSSSLKFINTITVKKYIFRLRSDNIMYE